MASHPSIATSSASGVASAGWRTWWVPAAIALMVVLTCAAYWPALTGGFILDDDLLLQNDLVKDPSGLVRMWFPKYVQKLVGHELHGEDPIDYWPASNSSLWLEWRLWGEDAHGYHVTNLVLHLATSLLIWVLLRELSIPGAYLAALLFAIHPVNVDSVAWISQRKTIMAMLFCVLSLLWYLKSDLPQDARLSESSRRPLSMGPWYWLSLVAFALGMLSKGSIAPLPAVLLLLAWWQRDRIDECDLLRSLPFFVLAVALTIVNVKFQDHGGGPIRIASFFERLVAAGAMPWFYLYKALLPINLNFIYPLWKVEPASPLWWAPLLAAVAATAILVWQRNTLWGRPLLFAWIFFCLMLIPVLGFADVSYMSWSLVADHYQYISLMAVVAIVAAAWTAWRQRLSPTMQPAAVAVAAAAVVVLAILAWNESRSYGDPITLYTTALKKNPGCWQAHYNLGRLYFAEGRMQDTIDASEASLKYSPENALPQNNAMTYNNIGTAQFNLGRKQEAIANLRKALELDPKLARAHYNLANMLFSLGERAEAFEHYNDALTIAPNFDDAHANLGTALVESGLPQEAIPHFQFALRIKPNNPEILCNLGVALLNMDRPQEAIQQFERALQLNPDHARAHYNLAKMLLKTGQTQQGLDHFQRALQIDPHFAQAHADLGAALARLGKPQDAIEHFQKALEVQPDLVEAQSNLAGAFAELHRYPESAQAAETALALARSQGRTELVQQMEGLLGALHGTTLSPPANIPSPALPPATP